MSPKLTIRPYQWQGAYAQWRATAPHDPGLCADVRAAWMLPDERLIIRSCEMIGYPQGYLYDDHYPPAEPESRGKNYKHISFPWDTREVPDELSAECLVPGKGRFTVLLRCEDDFVDIQLSLRNDTSEPLGPMDWAFCPITLESPMLRDPNHERTFIYDGQRLRSFRELDGIETFNIYAVAGARGFRPQVHQSLHPGSIEAQASVIIVEGAQGRYTAALGFEQSNDCFGCRGNMCFHADPYFGVIEPGRQKKMHGRLYLIAGDAQEALRRYWEDFKLNVESLQKSSYE